MLGIIGAMAEEVEQLKAEMKETKVVSLAGMDFYKGKIQDRDVVVVRSGIGKVNGAVCVQILVDLSRQRLTLEIWSWQPMQCSMMWMPRSSAMSLGRFPSWECWPLRQIRL